MDTNLVEKFCTPPIFPLSEFDSKILFDAEKIEIPFEEEILTGYSWGKGKTVLLVHGWGSRASHVAYMGRSIVNAGFRVIAYDAPAHSSYTKVMKKTTSNMFECCHALYTVQKYIGNLHAVIGHSLGAACAAFTLSGFCKLKDFRISSDKLVLISPPPSLTDVIRSFCRNNKLDGKSFLELKTSLEETFKFSADEYCIKAALENISSNTLIVHDTNDEEFPLSDIYSIHQVTPCTKLFITEGSGHRKILMNQKMISSILEYLIDN